MPRSHTLLVDNLLARGSADVDLQGPGTSASTNKYDSAHPAPQLAAPAARALRLSAPPRDVERLALRYGSSLPHYLDPQRDRAATQARLRWPILNDRLAAEPGA